MKIGGCSGAFLSGGPGCPTSQSGPSTKTRSYVSFLARLILSFASVRLRNSIGEGQDK
jgi:hypothetical protein